jgi:hypothetical protein
MARRIKIDMGEVLYALENSDYETSYFLDLDTGHLELIQENLDLPEQDEVKKKIDSQPDRYEKVPEAEPRDGYQDMLEFTETLTDNRLRELLLVALNGRGAFRRFKDVLFSHPAERERWFSFKNERMEERAKEWLNDIGVAADIK